VATPEHLATPAGRARDAVEAGRLQEASTWALVGIAEDLAAIRRDLHWQRQHVRADARRG
jgi:hypothetical protein